MRYQISDTGGRARTPKEYTTDTRQLEIRNSDARDERELQPVHTGVDTTGIVNEVVAPFVDYCGNVLLA
jgi:hypothetical protein